MLSYIYSRFKTDTKDPKQIPRPSKRKMQIYSSTVDFVPVGLLKELRLLIKHVNAIQKGPALLHIWKSNAAPFCLELKILATDLPNWQLN